MLLRREQECEVESLGLNSRRRTGDAVLDVEAGGENVEVESLGCQGARNINSKSLDNFHSSQMFDTYNKILTTHLLILKNN